eukprot:COSAG02_NODE_40495_length_405_cov_0.277778_1_plen_75_part_10
MYWPICRQILIVDLVTDCPCTGAENTLYRKCTRVSAGILVAQATVGHQKYSYFFKQKTAYEMESRDWSSDVCSSD